MRTIIVIFGLFLSSCFLAGQKPSEEAKKDQEFLQLLQNSKKVQEVNKVVIQNADKKTSEIITKTSNQIVSLKKEVRQLKSQLNEANKKLDSISTVDPGIQFNLLPVSTGKENW